MIASALHIGFRTACVALVASSVGLRAWRYGPSPLDAARDAALGESMVRVADLFLWPWAITTLNAHVLLVGVPVVLLLASPLLVRIDAGRLRLRPRCVSLLCAGAAWGHYAFDLSPGVAFPGMLLVLLALPLLGDPGAPAVASGRARRFGWSLFTAWALYSTLLAADVADRASLAGFASLLALAVVVGPRVLGTGDLRIIATLGLLPLNFAPALLPLLVPLHQGLPIGEGFAYDYCEITDRRLLAASVPRCSSIPTGEQGFESCRDGSIDFFSLDTLERVDRYHFFDENYYGRFEQLLCVGDEVHVAMQGTFIEGRAEGAQSAMRFRHGDADVFEAAEAGIGMGSSLAYDPKRDAMLFTGEFTGDIVRIDRKSGDRTTYHTLQRSWTHPLTRSELTGSLGTGAHAVDPEGDRFFVFEWMQGRSVFGVDLRSFEPTQRYDVYSGANMGVSIDAGRRRLIVTSLWGLEVFDLDTAALVLRRRLGFANRSAIVDEQRDRIWVASAIDGKLRALDRDSFEVLEQIPIGLGPRYIHLSSDGTRLFASSMRRHYAFELPVNERAR